MRFGPFPRMLVSLATGALFGYACVLIMQGSLLGFPTGWVLWTAFTGARILHLMRCFQRRDPATGFTVIRVSLHYAAAMFATLGYGMWLGHVDWTLFGANLLIAMLFAVSIPAGAKASDPLAADEALE